MIKRVLLLLVFFYAGAAVSQEGLRPLSGRVTSMQQTAKERGTGLSLPVAKTQSVTPLELPFLDDFSYASTTFFPDGRLWKDSFAYINCGYPIAPPSVGVATFDGLNQHGYPYTPLQTNLTLSDTADYLTSQPINLHEIPSTSQQLHLSDSIAISFYYQAKGNGEIPEYADSLVLQFYKPRIQQWVRVWSKPGFSSSNAGDTTFKRAFVSITDTARLGDTAYLHENFQFRFQNYATTSGDFDHWHIDYVYLDQHRRQIADTAYNDVTFEGVPGPYLKNYSAMPYKQYQPSEMAARTSVRLKNIGTLTQSIQYENNIFQLPSSSASTPTLVGSYNGGNDQLAIYSHSGCSTYTNHSNPPITYSFPVMPTNMVDYEIRHVVYRSTDPTADFIIPNDTVVQYQRFQNYYALDDGSAEAGYYVNGQGGQMAIKVTLNVPDTLEAMRIYFDPVGTGYRNIDSTLFSFSINVWPAGANGPAAGIAMYTDSYTRHALYDQAYFKVIPEYRLLKPLFLNPGTYYIGIQQKTATGITVGFDRNADHHQNFYFNSGGGWTQSGFHGSPMIHPVFGLMLPTGISENQKDQQKLFSVYPNPSSQQFIISSEHFENTSYQLVNMLGQSMQEDRITQAIQPVSTGSLSDGVYFLVIKNGSGQPVQQQKLIIQR